MSEKSAIGAIVAVTCMVVVLAVFAWFVVNTISYIPNTPGNSVVFNYQPTPTPTPPKPYFRIVDTQSRVDIPLLGSSTAYYDVYVRNSGDGGGYVTIHARMTQGKTAVDSEQARWVDAGERVCITFSFSEYSRWNGDATFRAWM